MSWLRINIGLPKTTETGDVNQRAPLPCKYFGPSRLAGGFQSICNCGSIRRRPQFYPMRVGKNVLEKMVQTLSAMHADKILDDGTKADLLGGAPVHFFGWQLCLIAGKKFFRL